MLESNFKSHTIINNKKIIWDAKEQVIVVPVDNIITLNEGKHYELKLICGDPNINKGLDLFLHRNDILNSEVTRIMLGMKTGVTEHPTMFRCTVMIKVYNVSKEEMQEEIKEDTIKLNKLEKLLGLDGIITPEEKKSLPELKADVNELFKQFFVKPGAKAPQ